MQKKLSVEISELKDLKIILRRILLYLNKFTDVDVVLDNINFSIAFWYFFAFTRNARFKLIYSQLRIFGFIFKGVSLVNIRNLKIDKGYKLSEYSMIMAPLGAGLLSIGKNFSLGKGAVIDCIGSIQFRSGNCVIGDNVGFSPYCIVFVRGELRIGDNVICGPNVSIFTEEHRFEDPERPIRLQGTSRKGVVIGDGCWLGSGTKILDGTQLGKNCVIAAGSIVKGVFEDSVIVSGAPGNYKIRKIETKKETVI